MAGMAATIGRRSLGLVVALALLCPSGTLAGLSVASDGVSLSVKASAMKVRGSRTRRSGDATITRTTYDSAGEAEWPMAGANPQRTSWTPEGGEGDA